eukprot:TRINITY_DN8449_c0_g1_i1.p1 TRINITY_DN8449_c0_g1~~TRINITY_DN8449_c0_g1_i1.p1  ORF type:complete len:267 (-),score=42.36 TRINITY_DN8449_c0_g1_i1:23-784(-)
MNTDTDLSSKHPLPSDWPYVLIDRSPPIRKEFDPEQPFGFVIQNVLSNLECQNYIQATEHLGFHPSTEITPIGEMILRHSQKTGTPVIWPASSSVRTSERLIWEIPRHEALRIFEIVSGFLPRNLCVDQELWELHGLNPRFRFHRYSQGQEFFRHSDASCASTTGHDGIEIVARSFLSLVMYLNDDFDGGETEFYFRNSNGSEMSIKIEPKMGECIVFHHDGSPLNVHHAGLPIRSGVKYILRTDAMYIKKSK